MPHAPRLNRPYPIAITLVIASIIIYTLLIENSGVAISSYLIEPEADTASLVVHKHYRLAYNEEAEQAGWVLYVLNKTNLVQNYDRRDNFRPDPLVRTGSADSRDYARSGYDRGHLLPAEEMRFDSIALDETFYYSNISPQLPNFNRGIWKNLEDYTRSLAPNADSIMVITGPVILESRTTIGENGVVVPDAFYKIIVLFNGKTMDAVSFYLPHETGLKGFENYVTSIDRIEEATGYDFLRGLPNRQEKRLESKVGMR